MSLDRLMEGIARTKNPTVAGLDPKLDYVPLYIREAAYAKHGKTPEGAAAAFLEYNKGLIDALCDIVPAVKPQAAYYEAYGWQGVRTLYETIQYAKAKGMFVITDGKRGDIGSTMEAYGDAHLGRSRVEEAEFEPFGGDALTVNGYLGEDGIAPLLPLCRQYDTGIFVLVKTSNKSSGQLQDREVDGRPVYSLMGDYCSRWGKEQTGRYGYGPVGAVVGATYPQQLAQLRAQLPDVFFLVPGYGTQGGGAADVAGAFDAKGLGAVVNSSRAILTAWQKEGCAPEDYAAAARREALRMKQDITAHIPEITL